MSDALLDTSVFVARRADADLPVSAAISVVSIGELRAGVELAQDPAVREIRAEWLGAVERAFLPIPVDVAIARRFGELLALARRERRILKTGDLLIIATAAVTGRRLVTHDVAQAGLAHAAGVPVLLLDGGG